MHRRRYLIEHKHLDLFLQFQMPKFTMCNELKNSFINDNWAITIERCRNISRGNLQSL